MNREEAKKRLLEVLADICEDDIVLSDPDVELFESGLLDSIAYMELLLEIERELGISVAPSEVEKEDVNTPSKLIEVVFNKL
ncbi:MAG: D-alanine--poly(phosphoribitol) ligase subunit DltC [Lachnospiraceae bacterium]|nr:D-alanine--poly(phosphoribitol) ligase subunit DltC [Lachnospiraceae bacterium]